MKKKFKATKEQIAEIQKYKLEPNEETMYFHCQDCLDKYFKDKVLSEEKSPKEAITYQAVSIPMHLKDVSIGIIAVVCNNCGKIVWDSRHLTHLY